MWGGAKAWSYIPTGFCGVPVKFLIPWSGVPLPSQPPQRSDSFFFFFSSYRWVHTQSKLVRMLVPQGHSLPVLCLIGPFRLSLILPLKAYEHHVGESLEVVVLWRTREASVFPAAPPGSEYMPSSLHFVYNPSAVLLLSIFYRMCGGTEDSF